MAKQMIRDLREGDYVSSYLQVDGGNLFNFRNKPGMYAVFTLIDKSGYIKGVCWDNGEKYRREISDGDIVYIDGRVVVFNGQLQINVDKLRAGVEDEYDPSDFIAVSDLDVESLFNDILEVIPTIQNPYLRKILESFFHDEDFAEGFRKSPAAKSVHHSYLGGLLEHTRNCMKLALTLAEIYPQLDRDMLLTGVIIHDIGKTVEMSFDRKVDYTDRGRLLGHIVIGQQMVRDRIKTIDGFPETLEDELLHLVISHHGENATGSPKRPKTAEACALHFLENLDAQTKRFIQIIEDTSNHVKDSRWTNYNRLLERYLYLGPEE